MKHLAPDVQTRILSEKYESDDTELQLCCFPGCVLPAYSEDGSLFPWYWYDTEGATGLGIRDHGLTLQETASMQVAHTF